jgi:hypothetical protein
MPSKYDDRVGGAGSARDAQHVVQSGSDGGGSMVQRPSTSLPGAVGVGVQSLP